MGNHLARGAVAALVALALLGGPTAGAALAATCAPVPTTKLFAAQGDQNDYFLPAGATFESGTTAWTRTGTTSYLFVGENETLGYAGSRVLRLAAGASVTAPALCVDPDRTHLRLEAEAMGGSGRLRIEALRDNASTVLLADIAASTYLNWKLTPYVPLSTALDVLPGATQWPRLRLTASGTGWSIDGIAVDPYKRG